MGAERLLVVQGRSLHQGKRKKECLEKGTQTRFPVYSITSNYGLANHLDSGAPQQIRGLQRWLILLDKQTEQTSGVCILPAAPSSALILTFFLFSIRVYLPTTCLLSLDFSSSLFFITTSYTLLPLFFSFSRYLISSLLFFFPASNGESDPRTPPLFARPFAHATSTNADKTGFNVQEDGTRDPFYVDQVIYVTRESYETENSNTIPNQESPFLQQTASKTNCRSGS